MAGNGTDFGLRVAGLYFPGFSEADANLDLGDSTITETAGFGGMAMACPRTLWPLRSRCTRSARPSTTPSGCQDVVKYMRERDTHRKRKLSELVRLSEEAGGYPELD